MEEAKIGRKVMVAVDETEESMYALQWALDHLIISGDSVGCDKLILMHAQLPALSKTALTGHVAFTGHVLDILHRREAINTQRILTSARGLCEKTNVAVESIVVEGEARYAICEAADKMRADLLVVGSGGSRAFKSWNVYRCIVGSVSDYCSYNVKCPVVIAKRQDQ